MPDSNVTISLWTSGVDLNKALQVTDDIEYIDEIDLNVEMRPCMHGEILTPNFACFQCEANHFSLEVGSDNCEDCPNEAVCDGGINMFPKKDYWRSGWDSDKFYKCRILGV